jgi:hypothetical protein
VRPSPTLLFRGLVKLVAVVAAASLAGIGIGAGLAKLSGDSPTASPVSAATTTTTSTEAATTSAQPGAVQGSAEPDVEVEVLSARLGTASSTTGHARVSAEIRVTNRAKTPVQITTALLISGDFNVPLDSGARAAAGPLLTSIAAGASATGKLRFTTDTAVTQRLLANPTAHLRIADKTIDLPLQAAQGTATTG